jgi:hypothetical protein
VAGPVSNYAPEIQAALDEHLALREEMQRKHATMSDAQRDEYDQQRIQTEAESQAYAPNDPEVSDYVQQWNKLRAMAAAANNEREGSAPEVDPLARAHYAGF